MPDFIFEIAFCILMFRVSDFLPEVTQHIHSLRASGVMSCQSASIALLEVMASRRSAGSLWIVPGEGWVVMGLFYIKQEFL